MNAPNKIWLDIVTAMDTNPDQLWTIEMINDQTYKVWGIFAISFNLKALCQREIVEKIGCKYRLNGRSSAFLQTLNKDKN